MDYGNILARAWRITWRWKVLWILGFLASLGSGFNFSSSNYRATGDQFGRSGVQIPPEVWAVVAAVACLGILLGIAVWVLSIIARGGLIAGVQQVEDQGATSLGAAWRPGVARFWTLFGISILTGLPALIVIVAGIIVLGLLAFGTMAAIRAAAEVGGVLGGGATLLCGGALCCGGILLAAVLDQIRVYGERAAVLEGLGWIDAVKRGWQVLKENLGPTVVLWLIFLVIGIIIAAVVVAPLFAVMMPLFMAMGRTGSPNAWVIVPLCFGGMLWVVLMAVVSSIVQTFTSATWTLAYRQFTGAAGLPPAEPDVEGIDEILDLE
jgi:hypothetical protein